MNFAITGKKIVSSQPQKKITLPLNNKPKVEPKPKQVIKPTVRKPSVPLTNKVQKKVQKKKQQIKKQPQTKIIKEQKVEQKISPPPKIQVQQPPKIEQLPLQPIKTYDILVRYNHYKDKFPTQNNILKYQVIEDKYGFSLVFKGNFQPRLQIYRNYEKYIMPLTLGTALQYTWQVEQGKQYEITIAEDELQESKYQRKAYIAPKQQIKCCPLKKNQRVVQLTNQMRQMGIQQLGGQKHKQLLQQRALEQILYS